MNVARIEKVSSAGDVRTLYDAQHGEAHQDGAPLLSVTPSVSAASWPASLASQAFHGAAGDLVRAIEPHTEADPAALLAQTLAAFGNVIGRSAHFRVEAVDGILRHANDAHVSATGALSAKRESVEALALELQAERVKGDLRKLRAEDADAQQRRAEAQRTEVLANKRASAELRLQQKRDAEERKREKLARQREEFQRWWMRWASNVFPGWLSEYQTQSLSEAVKRTLAGCDFREPDADVRRILEATIARVVAPWRAEREAWARREDLIEYAVQWRLPFWGTTAADKMRAASAARSALGEVPLSAGDVEVRAVVEVAVGEARREIEDRTKAEQVLAQAERARHQREANKKVLVAFGVGHISSYLSKLQSDGELWDEDWERKGEVEDTVRKALEEKLSGGERLDDAQRLAREIVDKELG